MSELPLIGLVETDDSDLVGGVIPLPIREGQWITVRSADSFGPPESVAPFPMEAPGALPAPDLLTSAARRCADSDGLANEIAIWVYTTQRTLSLAWAARAGEVGGAATSSRGRRGPGPATVTRRCPGRRQWAACGRTRGRWPTTASAGHGSCPARPACSSCSPSPTCPRSVDPGPGRRLAPCRRRASRDLLARHGSNDRAHTDRGQRAACSATDRKRARHAAHPAEQRLPPSAPAEHGRSQPRTSACMPPSGSIRPEGRLRRVR